MAEKGGNRIYKTQKDRISFFVGKLSVEIYWPRCVNNNADLGVFLPTQISYKKHNKYNEWWITRAGCIKILGFGFGVAWKHCDNPNLTGEK